jgi:hypothetical protein
MRDYHVTEDAFDGPGLGIELALPGDIIRRRHIATRASLRRRIVVLVLGDADFEGYAIGLDGYSLQLLELPTGEVSSIALDHIVAITDGKPFNSLTPEEKNTVDRRTASFRKTAQDWLVKNWPKVYDRRDDDEEHHKSRQRPSGKPPYVRYGDDRSVTSQLGEGLSSDVDSEARNGTSEHGDQV